MMGIWFLATSVGNFIGGRVSGLYESFALPTLFGAVAGFAIVAGVLLLVLSPSMRKLMPAPKAPLAPVTPLEAVNVVLLNTYDLGRQPFGLASPAAWLRRAGVDVQAIDLSRAEAERGRRSPRPISSRSISRCTPRRGWRCP